MKNNDSNLFWFQIPIMLIKIVKVLTKQPAGKPNIWHLELWGRRIEVSTDPEIGRVRMDITTLPILNIESEKPSKRIIDERK